MRCCFVRGSWRIDAQERRRTCVWCTMRLSRPAVPALALTTLGLALAAPAGAAPTPCGDPLLTDDAGDQFFEPTGLGALNGNFNKLGRAAGENTDITSLFFTTDATANTVDADIAI